MSCLPDPVPFDPSEALCEDLPRAPEVAYAPLPHAAPPGRHSGKGRGKGAPGYPRKPPLPGIPRKPRAERSAKRNLSTRLPLGDQMKLMAALTARDESVFSFVRRSIVELAAREGIALSRSAADYKPRRPGPVSFTPRLKD